MITDIITLSEERHTTLELFILENSPEFQDGRKRPAVLICPGGGYAYLSDREAAPIALRYAAMGFHAFVLRYGHQYSGSHGVCTACDVGSDYGSL